MVRGANKRGIVVAFAVIAIGIAIWPYMKDVASLNRKIYRITEARVGENETWQPCIQTATNRRMPLLECENPHQFSGSGSGVFGEYLLNIRAVESKIRTRLLRIADSKDKADIDRVVNDLKIKVENSPDNVNILNELAAAYALRASICDRPYDLAMALGRSLDSLEIRPDQVAAAFNVALFSTRLSLNNTAAKAWKAHLSRESDSLWAQEAKNHLRELERLESSSAGNLPGVMDKSKVERELAEIGISRSQAIRELVTEELLPSWGLEQISGNQSAASELVNLSRKAKSRVNWIDRTVPQAVDHVLEKLKSQDVHAIYHLARGHEAFGKGRRSDRRNEIEKAKQYYEAALGELEAARSPFVPWVKMFLVSVDIGQDNYKEIDLRVESISREIKSGEMPALLGIGSWIRGMIRVRQGDYSGGLNFYEDAKSCFAAANEDENMSSILELQAEVFRHLGQRVAQWDSLYTAIRRLQRYPESKRLHAALWNSAESATRDGEYRLAIQLHDEDLAVARRRSNPAALIEAHLRKGTTWAVARRPTEAWNEIETARGLIPTVSAGKFRNWTQSRVAFAASRIEAMKKPATALSGLTEAIRFYKEQEKPLDLLEALVARAHCYIDLAYYSRAENDLGDALSLAESQARLLSKVDMSLSFVNSVSSLHDLRVELALARNAAPIEVLDLIERARAVSLPISPSNDLSAAELVSRLDPQLLFIQWFLTGKHLVVIHIFEGHLGMRVLEQVEVEKATSQLNRWMVLRNHSLALKASRLLSELLMPEEIKSNVKLIVIASDKILNAVPISALHDYSKERLLIEIAPLTSAPSLGLYTHALRLQKRRVTTISKILIVDGTDWSMQLFPGLRSLPESKVEQDEIGGIYRGAVRYLRGEHLDRDSFYREMGNHQIVHFSGHAIGAADVLEKSFLVLGKKKGHEMLFLDDIRAARRANPSLLVLAACETMRGLGSRTGGLQSLGGTFIASGIPTVVGAIGEVEDGIARRFFVAFHKKLRAGLTVSSALRETQLEMIMEGKGHSGSVYNWALFQMSGPDTNI